MHLNVKIAVRDAVNGALKEALNSAIEFFGPHTLRIRVECVVDGVEVFAKAAVQAIPDRPKPI